MSYLLISIKLQQALVPNKFSNYLRLPFIGEFFSKGKGYPRGLLAAVMMNVLIEMSHFLGC